MGYRSHVTWLVRHLVVLAVAGEFTTVAVATPPADAQTPPTNRLARESSPYLLLHAHNPVDWFPWGPEAFEKPRHEKKLIFLSIGYSSCHWCHVMERESFANADVAKILNGSFVCIKVDREERPDIDQVYLTALQAMGLPGGWPLSMFLTADGKPIVGGTYWPPDDREINGEKVKGFKTVLQTMIAVNRERPQELLDQAEQVARVTGRALERDGKNIISPALDRAMVDATIDAVKADFDPQYGGFGNAKQGFRGMKFPVPPYLELLLQVSQRNGSTELLRMVTQTLDGMARGGLYDQIGGGFHRYSTERTWMVPHFEKLLYDNAQLVEVYAKAYQRTHNPLYRRVVEETLDFVSRDLTAPGGAFYSSLDADSGSEEGRYYIWTVGELESALPDPSELALAKRLFGMESANFGGQYFILARPRITNEPGDLRAHELRQKLLAARSKRVRPLLDTKVLTAWNGQMIASYAVAGQMLDEPRYTATAEAAADFILKNMRTAAGRLLHTYGAAPGESGRARLTAYLDDYAFVIDGLLCLHDATGTARWLTEATALADQMNRYYADEGRGFFYTASDHEKLFARAKDQHDGVQPSGNSAAVRDLLRLTAKTSDKRYHDLAAATLQSFAASIKQEPINLTAMVAALDMFLVAEPAAPPLPGQVIGEQDGAKRSDSVVKSSATADKPDAAGKQTITVKLAIDKGWHLYANPIGNIDLESTQTTMSVSAKQPLKAVKIDYPAGKTIKDALLGNYDIYEGQITFKAVIERAQGDTSPLEVTLKFQSCSESTCLVPATVKLTVP